MGQALASLLLYFGIPRNLIHQKSFHLGYWKLEPSSSTLLDLHYINSPQPGLHLCFCFIPFFIFNGKIYSISFHATFNFKTFQYFAILAKFLYAFKPASNTIACIGIKRYYRFPAQIIFVKKTFYWWWHLHV